MVAGEVGNLISIDGVGQSASFSDLIEMVLYGSNTIFLIDKCEVRRLIISTTLVTSIAGNNISCAHRDGRGNLASFLSPAHIVISDGVLFIQDSQTIRRVTFDGNVTTVVGNSSISEILDGYGTSATIGSEIGGMTVNSNGLIYFADNILRGIRTIDIYNMYKVTTLFFYPLNSNELYVTGIAVNSDGFIYVTANNAILKFTSSFYTNSLPSYSVFAGILDISGYENGVGTNARFGSLVGLKFDEDGSLYSSDLFYAAVRRISPFGLVTTELVNPNGLFNEFRDRKLGEMSNISNHTRKIKSIIQNKEHDTYRLESLSSVYPRDFLFLNNGVLLVMNQYPFNFIENISVGE